ncbi:MAG: hypothetical protein K8H88_24380, partial [Sandaracinaceae bacterium]|nr:hypothetical protein [Sandaracinaceae bacterium]
MTQVQTIGEVSGELGGFYVPAFEVYLGDRPVPDAIVRDVLDVSYHDSVDDIDGFELTLNNWDPDRFTFRYVGAPGTDESPFEPGQKVTLRLGYQAHLVQMLVGEITTLAPDFPEGGRPTLKIGGLNELHGFRREQHTWRFEEMRDSEIARWIGGRPVRRASPGLGFEVVAPNEANEDPENVEMHNEHDIVFLLRRARARGYTLAVRQRREQRYLYFGPPEHDREGAADRSPPQRAQYELAWGSGLRSFKPELTTANQV